MDAARSRWRSRSCARSSARCRSSRDRSRAGSADRPRSRPRLAEVFFVAGEASGDLHASGVAAELRKLRPDLKLGGIGGPRLAAEGVELMETYDQLAVMGLTEVIRHIPRHYALLKRVRERLRSGEIRLLILIDYPGFNMRLAESARAAGVPVLYYVTPQVWAWGAKRLPKLARTVTRDR